MSVGVNSVLPILPAWFDFTSISILQSVAYLPQLHFCHTTQLKPIHSENLKTGATNMGFRKLLSRVFSTGAKRRQPAKAAGLQVESLEQRLVLYATSGNAWGHPEVVTISFEYDGTNLGGVYSDMFTEFEANPNLAGVWQSEILRAAQVWAQATNLNFVVVSDSGVNIGGGSYVQGSPSIGDIRIGGYDFGTSTLAQAYSPPPGSNYSIAGDIQFNTATAFSVGSGIDLFTVAVHEFGHALGLNHSSVSTAQMYSVYNGVKSSLASDDIAGIRNIYSNNNARSVDGYDGGSGNGTFGNASNITGPLRKSTKSGIYENLDITTTSDVDFYKLTIPNWSGSTMTVNVQSAGLSLLAPKLTIYAQDQSTVLGTVTGTSGSTISLAINGVSNNDVFYYKVEGADSTPFGTGAYGITVDLGADTPPTLPLPNTMTFCGSPYTTGGPQADSDTFGFEADGEVPAAPAIAVAKASHASGTAAAGTQITVYDNGNVLGSTTTAADGTWYLNYSDLSGGVHLLTATATDGEGLTSLESDSQVVSVRFRKRSSGKS